jgi:hypothetical protein
MATKSVKLRVDERAFTDVVRKLLDSRPMKRENVKVKNPKNRAKVIPPKG